MSSEKSYDLSYLVEISGGDNVFIEEMISEFVETIPGFLDEIETYYKNENWGELFIIIHRIAPNFNFVGNHSLTMNVELLENACKYLKNIDNIGVYMYDIKNESQKIINELMIDYSHLFE